MSFILVTADSVGLYPNIPHHTGLKILKKAFQKRDLNKLPSKFVLCK